MLGTLRVRSIRLVAAACLALTTMLVGFAHRPLTFAAMPVDLSAYRLPDGTLIDLCHVDFDDGVVPPHDSRARVCDACLLTGAPGLGGPAEIGLPVRVGVAVVATVVSAQVAEGEPTRAPVSRGPPRDARDLRA